MKKIIYILTVVALFASCQKADKNGDLDGFWKLLQIEDFVNDTIVNTKEKDIFWSVQLDLMTTTGGGKGRFQHVGDSLFVQMIYVPSNPNSVGLYNTKDEHFKVVHLDAKKMILRSEYFGLNFRKF